MIDYERDKNKVHKIEKQMISTPSHCSLIRLIYLVVNHNLLECHFRVMFVRTIIVSANIGLDNTKTVLKYNL